ncbi:tetratricopeptide repeat protein [Atopobium deltae]|uniref:Tetratricopeptide repeat protein n=1 Tax=Atopobium deltae TaxID=1393034 RepID=A0A133XX79_9ACTN|nr:tetratricopeptide repeat protein [Atopobium deltae]KXB35514.1 tetratricopeptide repeat protein [Atopobium deltae]
MDQQAYKTAREAYQKGDWTSVVLALPAVKNSDELFGAADHLKGNALMKLGRFDEAAAAYSDALRDEAYGKRGALYCNQGRAFMAASRFQEAVAVLNLALQDTAYKTPYKAQLALGAAHLRLGNVREAGIAFRNAAIDEANPNPADALTSLGSCFMQLGRPIDAIEAYRTALDFSTPLANQNAIYAQLGDAYVAANRMSEALDAFNNATADKTLTLTPSQQAAYEAAQKAMTAITNRQPSETDALLQAAGYGGTGSYDPLDPLGKSGEMMPSPEDTGFFSVSESELIAAEKDNKKVRRKHRHWGRKILITLFVLLLLAAAAGCFAFYKGYGYPTQESIATQLFSSPVSEEKIKPLLATALSDDARNEIMALLPESSKVSISGVDRSMSSSKVHLTATLPQGGTQDFIVEFVRDGISWKVSAVKPQYASELKNSSAISSNSSSSSEAESSSEAGSSQQGGSSDAGSPSQGGSSQQGGTSDASSSSR